MKCGFGYCLYNRRGACILDAVEVDCLGMCASCITVEFEEEFLEEEKERQRHELEHQSK